MLKNLLAALLACLYIGLAAWLVRSEGQAYRDSINRPRQTRSASGSRGSEADKQAEARPSLADEPVADSEVRPAEPREAIAAHHSPSTAPKLPAADHGRPKHGGRGRAKASDALPEPPRVAMHKPASIKAPDVRHNELDQFWDQPEVKKKWDLAKLGDQEEMRLGEQLHDMIVQFNPPARNGELQERVYKAARPIVARVARKAIRYNFTILDAEEINAFSHPGGHVYLSRGMLPFIGEEEAVLQFVLAHEIAHVDRQDMIHCLLDPGVQSIDMGTLQKVYFLILPLGYLDQQEFAADQWAYRQLIALDHTRYESLKFLRKLKNYAAEHELSEGRINYKLRPGSSPVQNHLWANTAAWRRLDELETFVNQASPKSQ